MRYSVLSTKHADDQLSRIWTNSPGLRNAIAAASNEIDRELRDDPDQKGVSYAASAPGIRALDVSPLRAWYTVSEPDRTVMIVEYELLPLIP